MSQVHRPVLTWILIVSAIFAIMEIGVSYILWSSPQSVLKTLDINAQGVDYLGKMWAIRQFALGVCIAYATLKRSAPMLSLSYLFLLVMFVGDMIIGIMRKENQLIITAVVMVVISLVMFVALNKRLTTHLNK